MSTAPVVLEQDPTIVPAAVTPDAAEVLAPVAPVPVPEVKWHVYQPKDAEGRSIGGQQRISYTTQEELIEKLTHNHEESIRGLRDVRRKQRLGITEPETEGHRRSESAGSAGQNAESPPLVQPEDDAGGRQGHGFRPL